jgi:hypothetical protein
MHTRQNNVPGPALMLAAKAPNMPLQSDTILAQHDACMHLGHASSLASAHHCGFELVRVHNVVQLSPWRQCALHYGLTCPVTVTPARMPISHPRVQFLAGTVPVHGSQDYLGRLSGTVTHNSVAYIHICVRPGHGKMYGTLELPRWRETHACAVPANEAMQRKQPYRTMFGENFRTTLADPAWNGGFAP